MSESEICSRCGSEVEERHVFEPVTWGTDGLTEHGRHVFEDIEQRYQHCPECGEDYYTSEQARFREKNLNEAIKAKLGIDWLAERRKIRSVRAGGEK